MDPSRILRLKRPLNVIARNIEILKGPDGYSWVETDGKNIVMAMSKHGQFYKTQQCAWDDYQYYARLIYGADREMKLSITYHVCVSALSRADEIRRQNYAKGVEQPHYRRFNLRKQKIR